MKKKKQIIILNYAKINKKKNYWDANEQQQQIYALSEMQIIMRAFKCSIIFNKAANKLLLFIHIKNKLAKNYIFCFNKIKL